MSVHVLTSVCAHLEARAGPSCVFLHHSLSDFLEAGSLTELTSQLPNDSYMDYDSWCKTEVVHASQDKPVSFVFGALETTSNAIVSPRG